MDVEQIKRDILRAWRHYPFLQLLHKADGLGESLSLVPGQGLQVQHGLRTLGLQHPDGLQQSLVAGGEREPPG